MFEATRDVRLAKKEVAAAQKEVRRIQIELENCKRESFELVVSFAEDHMLALIRRYRQLVFTNDYGAKNLTAWHRETLDFAQSVFPDMILDIWVKEYQELMTELVEERLAESASTRPASRDIPTDPYDYEVYCAELLANAGWNTRRTQGSGDQGVDVLADGFGIRIAVRCKLYGQPVGNKAVQEIHTALGYYDADLAIVVLNQTYTKSARQLAEN